MANRLEIRPAATLSVRRVALTIRLQMNDAVGPAAEYDMARLTKRSIEAIIPGSSEQFAWDDEVSGFGVRVKPSGVRSYLVQYRTHEGRSRRLTVGRHGVLTVDEARKEARQVLATAARGGDPAGERQAARRAPTVSDLCDRYLVEHVRVHNKPSTAKEFERLIQQRVKPAIGGLKVQSVMRPDVIKLHRSMEATPRQANQALAVLSKMFNLAELWGLRPEGSNPCRLVKRYPEAHRERFLSESELARLGTALAEAERAQTQLPGVINAVRLLALTGCRLGEILALRWEHVDFRAGALILADGKTGARVHTIAAPALAVLASIPRSEGSAWVVHGRKAGEPLSRSTLEGAWYRIRMQAKLEGTRIHDLRHTVGTFAGQAGANAFLVRDKLGHKTLAMTGRYVNRDVHPLRALSEQVEGRIATAMGGKVGGKIFALRTS